MKLKRQRNAMWSVKFRGKEVQSPLLRKLMTIVLIISACIIIPVGLMVLLLTLPFAVVLHFILKTLGRRGFSSVTNGHYSFKINREGFAKRLH